MLNLIDHFNERAAICEYDAGISRATAEQRARLEVQYILETTHPREEARELSVKIWKENKL